MEYVNLFKKLFNNIKYFYKNSNNNQNLNENLLKNFNENNKKKEEDKEEDEEDDDEEEDEDEEDEEEDDDEEDDDDEDDDEEDDDDEDEIEEGDGMEENNSSNDKVDFTDVSDVSSSKSNSELSNKKNSNKNNLNKKISIKKENWNNENLNKNNHKKDDSKNKQNLEKKLTNKNENKNFSKLKTNENILEKKLTSSINELDEDYVSNMTTNLFNQTVIEKIKDKNNCLILKNSNFLKPNDINFQLIINLLNPAIYNQIENSDKFIKDTLLKWSIKPELNSNYIYNKLKVKLRSLNNKIQILDENDIKYIFKPISSEVFDNNFCWVKKDSPFKPILTNYTKGKRVIFETKTGLFIDIEEELNLSCFIYSEDCKEDTTDYLNVEKRIYKEFWKFQKNSIILLKNLWLNCMNLKCVPLNFNPVNLKEIKIN